MAARFSKTGDNRITIPDHADWDLGTGNFTLAAWAKPSTSIAERVLYRVDAAPRGYFLSRLGADWAFLTFGSVATGDARGGTPVNGDWALVIGTRVSDNVFLYVNNSQVGTDTVSGNVDSAEPLYLGNDRDYGDAFEGDIAMVAVWDTDLSASERSMLYAGGMILPRMPLSVAPANLKALWMLHDGSHGATITTVRDATGVHDGTAQSTSADPTWAAAPISLGAGPLIGQAPAVVVGNPWYQYQQEA
ncbi:MAG: LamG domain-containing protein, partial [Actinomycetota bacterium]|nr:LamG domain-containing protein [Actinomycetota bacterium]